MLITVAATPRNAVRTLELTQDMHSYKTMSIQITITDYSFINVTPLTGVRETNWPASILLTNIMLI